MAFSDRVRTLPTLGVGVSTELGAFRAPGALDLATLMRDFPHFAGFLEVGIEVDKGIDEDTVRWVRRGGRTTYHFLDVNLDEPEDFEPYWLDGVRALVERLDPAWLCGDAGLWHFGPRDRAHMLLLPPILSDEAASAQAEGIVRLREAVGREVLPENPPGQLYLGDLHLLDFFARVLERADTGLLLDCAHLAIYQRLTGHEPLTALDGFPLDRVVELHVAGGTSRDHAGFAWVDDDHTPDPQPDTWEIFEWVAARAPNLKAIAFECERNELHACLPAFERIARAWPAS